MSHLVCVLTAFLWLGGFPAQGLLAQGPWYVDGVNGLDAPGRGASPAAPWKTIGYAMAQATPSTSSGANVVYVAGGQEYSQATNGESFPVVLRPGIALVGFAAGASALPLLEIPAGATGIQLLGNQSYLRPESAVRGLRLRGGAVGIAGNAQGGFTHEPLMENCTFVSQAICGVEQQVEALGAAEIRITSCRFIGCANGVRAGVGTSFLSGFADLLIEDTVFEQTQGCAIQTSQSGSSQVSRGRIRGCHFDGGVVGIRVNSATGLLLEGNVFRMPSGTGIEAMTQGSTSATFTVRRSIFSDCSMGIQARSEQSRVNLTVSESTFVGCQFGVHGYSGDLPWQGFVAAMDRNHFLNCGVGASFAWTMLVSISKSRFEGCSTGLSCSGSWITLRLETSVIARNALGMYLDTGIGPQGPTYLNGLTVADNGTGLHSAAVYALSFPLYTGLWGADCSNCIFTGNVNDLVDFASTWQPSNNGSPGMIPLINVFTNSYFQGYGMPDPLVSRPTYKLSRGSVYIDRAATLPTLAATDFEGDPRGIVASPSTAGTPVDLGADEHVPQGSSRSYGTHGIGRGLFFPVIGASVATARIGASVPVTLTGAISLITGQAATNALLTFGWDDDAGTLPMDLSVFGLRGSLLWNDFVTTFPIQSVTGGGTSTYPVAIPNVQSLVGLTTTYQWFAMRPDGDIVGSDGLRVTIGQ